VLGSFSLDLAMYGHQFSRSWLQAKRRRAEEERKK
jgi:hypothetical protein